MATKRIGGLIFFKVGDTQYDAKGDFSYSLGIPMKKQVVGSDGVHGYTVTPQIPFIEGKVTDNGAALFVQKLRSLEDVTVTLLLSSKKTIQLNGAVEASDGTVTTGEGECVVRFEGSSAEEVGP